LSPKNNQLPARGTPSLTARKTRSLAASGLFLETDRAVARIATSRHLVVDVI